MGAVPGLRSRSAALLWWKNGRGSLRYTRWIRQRQRQRQRIVTYRIQFKVGSQFAPLRRLSPLASRLRRQLALISTLGAGLRIFAAEKEKEGTWLAYYLHVRPCHGAYIQVGVYFQHIWTTPGWS